MFSRIRDCIRYNEPILNLSHLELDELPEIPSCVENLYCDYNNLTELPDNLPSSLKILWCNHNKLSRIPNKLPDSLEILWCHDNKITALPDRLPSSLKSLRCDSNKLVNLPNNLPSSLKYLYCYDNQITKLPDNLPESLQILHCYSNWLTELPDSLPAIPESFDYTNRYLYVTKEQALRFGTQPTLNYPRHIKKIQNRWREKKRYRRLVFCRQIEDHASELLLRPGNYFHTLLLKKNKNLFIV